MEPTGAGRLPVVDGWTAYLDDSGPTLATNRARRQEIARWCGLAAAPLWIVTAVAVARADQRFLILFPLVAAAVLTAGCFRYGRTTPRWTAVPGAVVRRGNAGGKVTFAAEKLVLDDRAEIPFHDRRTLLPEG